MTKIKHEMFYFVSHLNLLHKFIILNLLTVASHIYIEIYISQLYLNPHNQTLKHIYIYLFLYICVYLCISLCLSVYVYTYVAVCICPSVHPSMYIAIYLSI